MVAVVPPPDHPSLDRLQVFGAALMIRPGTQVLIIRRGLAQGYAGAYVDGAIVASQQAHPWHH
jgi:hypothetical protein